MKPHLSAYRGSSSGAEEPYLVTPRTLASAECSLGGYLEPRSTAVVRGWLFDRLERITRVRFSAAAGEMGIVVHSIERPNVTANFPSYRHSLESGFSLLVYLDPEDSAFSSLQFSYKVRAGGEVHGRYDWGLNL